MPHKVPKEKSMRMEVVAQVVPLVKSVKLKMIFVLLFAKARPEGKPQTKHFILCIQRKHRPLDCFFWTRKDLSLISECTLFCWSHLT